MPSGNPLKVNVPVESVVNVADTGPTSPTAVPALGAAGVIVPVTVTGCAVKFAATFPSLTVTAWLAGVNVNPALVGVTV